MIKVGQNYSIDTRERGRDKCTAVCVSPGGCNGLIRRPANESHLWRVSWRLLDEGGRRSGKLADAGFGRISLALNKIRCLAQFSRRMAGKISARGKRNNADDSFNFFSFFVWLLMDKTEIAPFEHKTFNIYKYVRESQVIMSLLRLPLLLNCLFLLVCP